MDPLGKFDGTYASDDLRQAIQFLRSKCSNFRPRVGIILGSGLGDLGQSIQSVATISYGEIPGFPVAHVSGHAGRLIMGRLAGTDVVALQGRCHFYEGWEGPQAALPVRTVLELGVELLILSNASGGVNPRFHSGQIVLIDSHIDGMFRPGHPNRLLESQLLESEPNVVGRHLVSYDRCWIDRAQRTAQKLGFSLPTGTYWATLGPNYETRAEYRMFRNLGADMVGMSTVPEANIAFERGIDVLAFSIVTNVANSDVASVTDHADVLNWSARAKTQLLPLVQELLSEYFQSDL
jgi:purine-nucleoside phosphorylase